MSYRTCYIKNIEGVTNILYGKSFAIDEIKQINDSSRIAWMGSQSVDDAISTDTHEVLDNNQDSLEDKLAQRNWLRDYDNIPKDTDGRTFVRLAMTEKGWKFLSHTVKIKTATEYDTGDDADTIAVRQINFKGELRNAISVSHLKAGVVVTDYVADAALIDETRVTIKPPTDYEILKGTVSNVSAAAGRCEVGVAIGSFLIPGDNITQLPVPGTDPVIYVDAASEFLGGLDLEHFVGVIHIDGESSKKIYIDIGYGIDMNQAQVRIHHKAGLQHTFMCSLEYYRA